MFSCRDPNVNDPAFHEDWALIPLAFWVLVECIFIRYLWKREPDKGGSSEPRRSDSHLGPESCFTGWAPDAHSDESPEPPAGSAREDDHEVLQRIAARGFTLGSLLELFCLLLHPQRALSEIEGLRDAYKQYARLEHETDFPDVSWFDPSKTATWEVAYRAIVPLSRKRCTALSMTLTGQRRCFPRCIVSHTWGNIFAHTAAACVADALNEPFYFHIVPLLRDFDRVRALMLKLGTSRLSMTYWLCALSINQHTIGCDSSPWSCKCGTPKCCSGPQSEIGAFDKMMTILKEKHPSFYQVVAIDIEMVVVERVWVVAEIAEAHRQKLRQVLQPHFPLALSGQLLHRIDKIDVNMCHSTMPEDKVFILNKIPDKEQYNKDVKTALSAVPLDQVFKSGSITLIPLVIALATQQITWAVQAYSAPGASLQVDESYTEVQHLKLLLVGFVILNMCGCMATILSAGYWIFWLVEYRLPSVAIRRLKDEDELYPDTPGSKPSMRSQAADSALKKYEIPGNGPTGSFIFLWATIEIRWTMVVLSTIPYLLLLLQAFSRIVTGDLGCPISANISSTSFWCVFGQSLSSGAVFCIWIVLVSTAYYQTASTCWRCLMASGMVLFFMLYWMFAAFSLFLLGIQSINSEGAAVMLLIGVILPAVLLCYLWFIVERRAQVAWLRRTDRMSPYGPDDEESQSDESQHAECQSDYAVVHWTSTVAETSV